jgi:mannitol-1-/sugar-/sorbitol-6-phosphatase
VCPAAVGNFKGILFDNEGTLIDASEATRMCWSSLAGWYNLPVDEVLSLVPGRPARDVIGHYAESLPVPVDDALRRYLEFSATCTTGIRPIPGARELLAKIPADQWIVVTSGTREFALRRIVAAGLPVPAQLVSADDVNAGKPDPEPYMVAARKLRLHPSDCLAIDDSPAGIESASRAGCMTLALLTTHPRSELPDADVYANDLSSVRVSNNGHGFRVFLDYE